MKDTQDNDLQVKEITMNKAQADNSIHLQIAFILYAFTLVLLAVGALVGIQELPTVSITPVFIFGGINIVSVIYLLRRQYERSSR